MSFTGASILSIEQFSLDDIERIFAVADRMQPFASRERVTKALDGAILGNIFLERSTRITSRFCANSFWL